ncbi:MAG: hypothetical protein IJX91_05225 [Clostridia bacterium]|nr:hypothetical protein [Clostridia bacterium]
MNKESREQEERTEEKEEFFAESGTPQEEIPEKKSKKKRRVTACVIAGAIALCSFFGGWLTSYLSLDKEMRALNRLKSRIQKSYYEEVTDEEFYSVLFSAVNERILDAYSAYMTEEEYAAAKKQATGSQSGLGLAFSSGVTGEEELKILRVSGNSPAEEAGLVAGEYIVGYGADEKTDAPMQTEDGEGYFETFYAFLSGYETGETLYLRVRAADGTERVVPIAKAAYIESYVSYRTNARGYGFTDGDYETVERGSALKGLPDDAAYIRLTQFNGNAAEEFDAAMELFSKQKMKTLVLDLRGNGGGYLDIMLEIASYFCKDSEKRKPVAAIADYGESTENFYATGNCYDEYFKEDSRIFVLADNQTASASECLIGCMLDYNAISYGDICLAERGGEVKTYGKGIMQTTYPLTGLNGDAVKLTTARICWPVTNNCIHERGIVLADGTKEVAENADYETETKNALSVLFG